MNCSLKDLTKVEYLNGDTWKLVRVSSLVNDDKDLSRCPECKGKVELNLNGNNKPHFRHYRDRRKNVRTANS